MSQIFEKQSNLDSSSISQTDLDYLSSNGYVLIVQKSDHDRAASELANMEEANQRLQQERTLESEERQNIAEDEKKVHGVFFDLHGKEYKDEAREKLETDSAAFSKNEVPLSEDEARVSAYIQKKSALDQLVPFGDVYLSLTGAGVIMLSALNAGASRVSDVEFSDFAQMANQTDAELKGIAFRASNYVHHLGERISFPSPPS